MAAGFQVHKDACSTNARMIGGDFQGTRLAPNQDKMWLAVFGIQEILARKWELPDSISRIVGILSWGFLICRGALSIFFGGACVVHGVSGRSSTRGAAGGAEGAGGGSGDRAPDLGRPGHALGPHRDDVRRQPVRRGHHLHLGHGGGAASRGSLRCSRRLDR
eukprot:4834656-Pyramimonas_sp.AAC.1